MYADEPVQVAAFPGHGGGRASSIETGTKLYISNLDYGVSSDDIKVPDLGCFGGTCVCLFVISHNLGLLYSNFRFSS